MGGKLCGEFSAHFMCNDLVETPRAPGVNVALHSNQNDKERKKTMSFGDGVKVALFVMSLVFAMLASVYALIKLASAVIQRYISKAAKN